MSPRALSRWMLGWAIATAIACITVHRVFALDVDEAHPRAVVGSVWSGGELVAQAVLARGAVGDARLEAALASHPGGTLVYESIVADGPVVARPEAALAISFVAGRDGISAT